jgi:hypothetical protein
VSSASPNIIERREYKFLIDRPTVAAVRAAIRPFCILDPYAAQSPSRSYTIETLYLDTTDLSLFWANDHELVDRVKVRVRRYADKPGSPIFLEVKRRINDVIAKSRGRVPAESWTRLLADPAMPIPADCTGKDRAAVERFLALHRSLHLRPYTLVRYQREPWISTIDDYARVTFDTWIQAHTLDSLTFEPDGGRTQDSLVVLELKFTNQVPIWLVNIVRSLGLVRGAYSKYGNSIRAFHQPVDIRMPRLAGGWR